LELRAEFPLQEISRTHYPRRMRLKYLPTSVLVAWLLFATSARAQDNPLADPDLQQLLKQAQEMQKNARDLQKSPGSPDTRKKLADMEAMAKEQAAQQEQEEKDEKEKLQAALKKQLEAPGPVAFPDWTPVTPEFKPAGMPTKKLIDEEVKIVQTGTSSLTPEKIADSWQATAAAANNLNQSLNNINVNGKTTRILFLSTRTDPRQEVELEASREPASKVTQVEISSPLPKPDIGSE
jgi:hypothetical protein